MRSILIAAALSCACLPGKPVDNSILSLDVFPVSNTAAKSSRLDVRVDLASAKPAEGASYRVASADPAAMIVEAPESDGLANTGISFEQTEFVESGTAQAITAPHMDKDGARDIDTVVMAPRILADPDLAPPISKEDLCGTLADAAQAHHLPVVFFNNLIWQESRFKTRAVSPVGAQGVAQFMPEVAASVGLDNPFDAFQALPASARLLRDLLGRFGNLGLAAAAYNAGPKRVVSWLSKRSRLPAETRNYVRTITGRAVEHWRGKVQTAAFRLPAQAPCRSIPTFAAAEEAARQQEARQRAEIEKARAAKNAKRNILAQKPASKSATVETASKTSASKPVQLASKKSPLASKAPPAQKKLQTASLGDRPKH